MGKHHAYNGYLDNGDNFYFQTKAVTVAELLERTWQEGQPIRLLWSEDTPSDQEQTDVLHKLSE